MAVLGGLGTALLAIINNWWQFRSTLEIERTKREAPIIQRIFETNERTEQARRLYFFLDAGLLSDPTGRLGKIKKETFPTSLGSDGSTSKLTGVGSFKLLEAPATEPPELAALKQGKSEKIISPPTMDQAPLVLPAFDKGTDVWLEATCSADCFDDRSFVGVTISYNGNTVVQRESPQGRGLVTASAFVKVRVAAGSALQFVVDGADFLAKRKDVAFAAYYSPAE